ncbi:MAG: amino acid ABC transporter permease [Alsobacter sp.]|jgi:polar amino acid transport system permease protein
MTEFFADTATFLPVLLRGLGMTVLITICALALSVVLGFALALMKLSGIWILSITSSTIINIVRGIPIIVQLFFVYFVLPELGIVLDAFPAGVIGLGIAYSVYQAENLRGGFESVDPLIVEAGTALGMGQGLLMRRVIVPLGIRTALPSFGNTTVMLLKDSSIASTITVAELTRAGQLLAISTFKNGTVYALIALLYLATSLPLAMGIRALERRAARR